jgi:hypothetical protein
MLKKTLSGLESPTLPQAGECCVRNALQNKGLKLHDPLGEVWSLTQTQTTTRKRYDLLVGE